MKKEILIAVVVGMIASTQTGCMSAGAINLRFHDEGEGAYFGTKIESSIMHAVWNGDGLLKKSRPKAVLVALDLPFTAVSDTVFLPFDLTVFHPARRARQNENEGSNRPSEATP